MSKSFLMGNEAIGLGAVRAGVQVVSGYPGTPSTEVLETVAKHNPGDIYVEWSVNEKAAMEVAAAAAATLARFFRRAERECAVKLPRAKSAPPLP